MAFTRSEGVPILAFTLVGSPQVVNLSGSSGAVGTALKGATIYRVWASTDCFIKFGSLGVTATTSDHPLTAKIPEEFVIVDGGEYVAGITSGGTGSLYVSELG